MFTNNNAKRAVPAIVAGLVLAAGPVGIGGATGEDGGVLRVALMEDPGRLDPTLSNSRVNQMVLGTICERLYDVTADGEIVPRLAAADAEVSDDLMTITIPLREGVTFSDGTAFDAEAVVKGLDRHRLLEGTRRTSDFSAVESIEAIDELTVQVNMARPFAPFIAALTGYSGMIVSPTAAEELAENFNEQPSCVGPFRLKESVPQTSVEVERDPNYYAADEVALDGVIFSIIPDSSIRMANLMSGDVDVIDSVPATSVGEFDGNANIQLATNDSFGYFGITVNAGNRDGVGKPPAPVDSPFMDIRVRQALDLAIDRQALIDVVFDGQYTIACGPIPPSSPFSSERSQQCVEPDPERARELLEETGLELPVQFELMISTTAEDRLVGEVIQAMAAQVGFDVVLAPIEFSSGLREYNAGNYQARYGSWAGRLDPDGNTANLLGSGGAQNNGGYSNARFDELMAISQQTTDLEVRREAYGEAVEIIAAEVPIVYLFHLKVLTGVSSQVDGVYATGDGIIRVNEASFAG